MIVGRTDAQKLPAERVDVSEADLAREFMRRHLGDDWELRLMAADATAGPDTSVRNAIEAQMRAVDLVSEVCRDWRADTRLAASDAWRELWHDARRPPTA